MSALPTQFPIPATFQSSVEGEASPERFWEYLNFLLTGDLQGNTPAKIPVSDKAHWVTVVYGLADYMLGTFPYPQPNLWANMHERLRLSGISLDVIPRVIERVESFHVGVEDLSKKIFARLLGFCNCCESWLEYAVPEQDGDPSPQVLSAKALECSISFLRCSCGSVKVMEPLHMPSWGVLQDIITGCLETCHDIITMSSTKMSVEVVLFDKPHIREMSDEISTPIKTGSHSSIMLPSEQHFPIFMGIIIDILCNTVCSDLPPLLFMMDSRRRLTELCLLSFDYCLSCPTSPGKRSHSLARIVKASRKLMTLSIGLESTLSHLLYRLLLFRLVQGPSLSVDPCDIVLAESFAAPLDVRALGSHAIKPIVHILDTQRWGDSGNDLRILAVSFIKLCSPHLDPTTLATVDTFLRQDKFVGIPRSTRDGNDSTFQAESFDFKAFARLSWISTVAECAQQILRPDDIKPVHIDGSASMVDYESIILTEIRERYNRPLHATSAPDRIALAENVIKLVDLFQEASHFTPSSASVHHTSRISAFLPVFRHLIDGPVDEVTNDVWKHVYNLLSRMVDVDHLFSFRQNLPHMITLINIGLANSERDVRICAGRAFHHIVASAAHNTSEIRQCIEPFFHNSYRLFETGRDSFKETTMVIVGSLGRIVNVDILGHVIICLVSQLGRDNPLLKGLAYTQLLAVAKHHKKSPYGLVSPYISQISPLLVSRVCSHPPLLSEFCRFVAISPRDFISITLPYTLPTLFANCESQVIERISLESSIKQFMLFLNHSHVILAHVYMLQGPGQTNKGLNFILKILSEGAHHASIDLHSVLHSCVVPLLAELVVGLGEEDVDQKNMAELALRKVHRALITSAPTEEQRVLSQENLQTLLVYHMLGIITNINEMLQDVQGKKSTSAKQRILRGLGSFIGQVGSAVVKAAPQIMATLQTMLQIPELAGVTLSTWHKFITSLNVSDIGPHVGSTSASFLSVWTKISALERGLVHETLRYIIFEVGDQLQKHLDDVIDFRSVPELLDVQEKLQSYRRKWTPRYQLQKILDRSVSDNFAVVLQSLDELKFFLSGNAAFISSLTSGDFFDPIVGHILSALFTAAARDGDGAEMVRLLAFECMGILGALDPDRCEIPFNDSKMVVLHNFTDEDESVVFALHLIQDVLVSAFRSTSDMKHQGHLAYTIQNLLKFCKFSRDLVTPGNTVPVSVKVRSRWSSLPKHVLETVTPLLGDNLSIIQMEFPQVQCPIYAGLPTYREWIGLWTGHLITKASGDMAQSIFGVFRSVVRNKDVGVAHHLLPHLVLNVLLSGNEHDTQAILTELSAVLEDQVNINSASSADKKLLSAQAVFLLLDHLSKYVRIARQDITSKKADTRRPRGQQVNPLLEEQIARVDSVLSSINHVLMAKAALQCKSYARSLMNFERQIVSLRERRNDLTEYYERLHEIYAHLDEPDGMEGISTLILSPSLEHEIRQHESTGRWTSAQSCWEVRLQQSPNNIEFQLGLLNCLRKLGHYDTLRTHVEGILLRHPEWQSSLAGFQAESAWMIGAWDDVEKTVKVIMKHDSATVKAQILLAMRSGNRTAIDESLANARTFLGASIAASGIKEYRRSYDVVVDLHLVHELEIIHRTLVSLPATSQERQPAVQSLRSKLAARLDATLPNPRIRESVLSMRRTAFALIEVPRISAMEIGKSWLASAKFARKAGQWQTAYSAVLQAQQSRTRFHFMESAKLLRATGEPLRALQELENSMRLNNILEHKSDPIDNIVDDDEKKEVKGKAHLLRARWMHDSDRFEISRVLIAFQIAVELCPQWESSYFYLGKFHDRCWRNLSIQDQERRGVRMNLHTIRNFVKASIHGSKFVYQTIPRLLTLWLDMGENPRILENEAFAKINHTVAGAVKSIPAYKWFTAFPQIVSRVGHTNKDVYNILSNLITMVISDFPHQALWFFISVVKSTKQNRETRGKAILEKLRSGASNAKSEVPSMISLCLSMSDELLRLCNYPVHDDRKSLSMKKDFPKLARLGRSPLLIPLQDSLTASLPPSSQDSSMYQPFPTSAPTFDEFFDDIDVMRSLARPKKITIRGSNGQIYMFLCKPKDDLRKDARLMDLNAIINKLLKANSESRRRQLRIRTYGVVTLNEECGLIQWVPNTIPVRPVLVKRYDARSIKSWNNEMGDIFKKIKEVSDRDAGQLFVSKILSIFPPVFHEWFIETFPEPSAWLSSRLSYGRTAAVMSMVGFILGLGDRHCENILLDTNTGDVVHVDFNCLFEKGKTLETPERVPFRLTQNLVDGLGVTGVEGVFRVACEVTLQLLRDNKDSLMSVLDAFIHDPLVEWEDEKRRMDRDPARRNAVKSTTDLRHLAKNALDPIEKKFKGIYAFGKERQEREMSTSNLVQVLIQEATDEGNLAKMYPGWAAWH